VFFVLFYVMGLVSIVSIQSDPIQSLPYIFFSTYPYLHMSPNIFPNGRFPYLGPSVDCSEYISELTKIIAEHRYFALCAVCSACRFGVNGNII
jgi:hypothetical protein